MHFFEKLAYLEELGDDLKKEAATTSSLKAIKAVKGAKPGAMIGKVKPVRASKVRYGDALDRLARQGGTPSNFEYLNKARRGYYRALQTRVPLA